MVKLLRLTTDDNCKFNADLDAGIDLDVGSSMALQNLTFETDFPVLDINDEKDNVSYKWDSNVDYAFVGSLTTRKYTRLDYTDFYTDLERALNATQKTVTRDTYAGGRQDIYAQFRVLDGADYAQIQYKYAPICRLFHLNDSVQVRDTIQKLVYWTKDDSAAHNSTISWSNAVDAKNCGNIAKNPASNYGASSDSLNTYVAGISGRGYISRGNGMVSCNVNNLADHAGTSEEHGFGMGLSFGAIPANLPIGSVIPTTSRDFEIRVQKTTDVYKWCSAEYVPGSLVSSTVTPFKFDISVDTDPTSHDVLFIEKQGKRIIGRVCNMGVASGQTTTLFTYELTEEEQTQELYPYFYVCGRDTTATIGNPIVVIDSLQVGNEEFEITGKTNMIVNEGGEDPISIYKKTYYTGNAMPIIDSIRMIEVDNDVAAGVILEDKISSFMGWKREFILQNQYLTGGVWFKAPLTFIYPSSYLQFNLIPNGDSFLTNSDNYVVMLDSTPLKSYDASKFNYADKTNISSNRSNRGRKLNILATIPINNNAGIVEYDSNELVFIDIDNKFQQTLKNIRLRVLIKT